MLLCRALLLLLGLSACAVAGDEEPALSGTEARSWLTVTLEEDVIPSVQLQLQEVQRGRVSQFFGLMGKRVGEREGRKRERERERNINVQLLGAMACNPGVPLIQPARTNGRASARTDGPGPPRQERTIHGRQRG
ncbi:tachykinin precursor 4 [Phyllostomus discolor]|uniref:Tachykinin 4 n=1 Tax=Phyllostomus discolor TaxID=89673 RepID=A0A834DYL7_9CHIR|nr:tachykinin precursor 4 [Phyllostomus discolor]